MLNRHEPNSRLSPAVDRRQFLGACAAGMVAASAAPSLGMAGSASSNEPAHTAPLAFWALTGKLASDDVNRQLDAFSEAGWGAVLYPRWGLEIEYLSDAWFDRIRHIIDEAANRDMEIWLYDEFCWPSGHAKGLVTKDHPELAAQILCVEPDGRTRIEISPENANMVMRAATDRFLAVTHERYADAVGHHFGKTIRAIFTDEPSLPSQHKPRKPGETAWRFMWSDQLNQALGGEFVERLAEAGAGVATSPLWRDYWAAYAKVYHDAWTRPIADWCAAHKVALSGHLLGENDFGSHVTNYGSARGQLSEFHIPGIDEISTRWEVDRCEALTLATIAEFPGRERMVEAFALGPCTMQMDTMRKMVDLCAACGVDRYVMAISPFDLRGNYFQRNWLSVLSVQSPWFRHYARPFAEYLAEAAKTARKAQPLGVPWPTDEELWEVAGPSPRHSKALQQKTSTFREEAREAIRARMAKPSAMPIAHRTPLDTAWTFQPAGLNSLRIDRPSLTVLDVPATAELSIQTQLVKGVRINGAPVDLASAPIDTQFDLSYRRLSVTHLLRVGENTFVVESDQSEPLKFLPALILWGGFAVDDKQQLVAPPKTIPLGDWRRHGYPAFCGVGQYRATVQWPVAPSQLGLDAGGYPARVLVNGKECGRRPWGPFQFNLQGAARSGTNEIVIEVAGTIGHLFIPQTAPPIGLIDVWTC